MKRTRKIIALILTLCMVFGMFSTVYAAHTHTYGDPTYTISSDMTVEDVVFTCTSCGETIEGTAVAEVDGDTYVCPDCETDGKATLSLSFWYTEDACENDEEPVYTTTLTDYTIPAFGHEWDDGVVTTEATATTDGVMTYTCEECGKEKTEVIPKTGVPLAITAQSGDVSGAVSDKITFSVTAEGEGLTYQWYVMKVGESGFRKWMISSDASFSTRIQASWDGMQVYCEVSDSNGNTVNSTPVTVTIPKGPEITQQLEDIYVVAGEKATFSVAAEGDNLTYQWYVMKSGESSFRKWTISSAATFSVNALASWDDMLVYCRITDADGNATDSDVAAVHIITSTLKITEQPTNISAAVGEKVTFSVTAEGENLSYAWYVKKADESGFRRWTISSASTFSTRMLASWDGMQVYCMVTAANGKSITSDIITLTIPKGPEISVQPTDVSGAAGEKVTFSLEAVGDDLTYTWYVKKASEGGFREWTISSAATFTIKASAGWDNMQVYCIVADADGNKTQSDTITVHITE